MSSSVVPNDSLGQARFLAGLTPVQGPGVVVTLRDSKKPFPRNMPQGMAPPSIIHDSDINQVVNELKAAGAEAIAVNDQRLVATSSVRTAGPTVLINLVPTAPCLTSSSHRQQRHCVGHELPGGVASQIKAFDSAMFSVEESDTLTLPAYSAGEPAALRAAFKGGSNATGRDRFLSKRVAEVQPHQRLAEEALASYKAHHQTRQI